MVRSDAGALLLGRTDEAIGLIDRLTGCFTDARDPQLIEHTVRTLIGRRNTAHASAEKRMAVRNAHAHAAFAMMQWQHQART